MISFNPDASYRGEHGIPVRFRQNAHGSTTLIGVVTNARAAGQTSMIGYGKLLLEAARASGAEVSEFRGSSALSRVLGIRRTGLGGRFDRFVVSPLKMLGKSADIVHVVDPGNAPYLSLIRHRASIVTVHDMIPYLCDEGSLTGFQPSRLGLALMRRILKELRRATRIVCVSESTRRDVLHFANVHPDRIVVIPNAVFQPMQRASTDAQRSFRASIGLPEKARFVLNVGRNFYKNRETVVEVFARLKPKTNDLHLVFVSPPSTALEGAITVHSLRDRVHFVKSVPPSDMAAAYSAASLLLFPSLYEGFGYPVLEAQLCGTPVICSNAGSLPEVAGSGAILFDACDVDGMARAAEKLLFDGREAGALAELGRTNAERFNSESWLAATCRLYDEL